MVDEIIELYDDAQLYDDQNFDVTEDLPFWAWAASQYALPALPILELGSGTGRVSLSLADLGHSVLGLDLSPQMVSLARKKYSLCTGHDTGRCKFHVADVRNFELSARFPLILFPYNSMSHLTLNIELDQCLTSIRKHLLPGGRFVFSVFLPLQGLLNRDPKALYPLGRFKDSSTGKTIDLLETMQYDPWTQINHITWYFFREDQEEPFIRQMHLRMFYPQETEYILKANGFKIEHRFGDFNRELIQQNSVVQVIVASLI